MAGGGKRCGGDGPTSGTWWWINAGDSGIVSQGLPRAEMELHESTLLCLPSSLHCLKGWQAKATALPAAGEARRKWFWSLRVLWLFRSKWEHRTTLSFPAATHSVLIHKGQMLSDLPTGTQLRMQTLNTQVPSEYYIKLKINRAAKRRMHHTYK